MNQAYLHLILISLVQFAKIWNYINIYSLRENYLKMISILWVNGQWETMLWKLLLFVI